MSNPSEGVTMEHQQKAPGGNYYNSSSRYGPTFLKVLELVRMRLTF